MKMNKIKMKMEIMKEMNQSISQYNRRIYKKRNKRLHNKEY